MRYLFNKGRKFSYRVLSCIFGRSKSHIPTLLTAKEPVEEIDVGGKKVLIENGVGPHCLQTRKKTCWRDGLDGSNFKEIAQILQRFEIRLRFCMIKGLGNIAILIDHRGNTLSYDIRRQLHNGFMRLKHFTLMPHSKASSFTFSQVLGALMLIKSARQLVNLEVGLCQRLDKGRRRRVVSLKEVSRKPSFSEENDGSRLTLTAAVNFGKHWSPIFLGWVSFAVRVVTFGCCLISSPTSGRRRDGKDCFPFETTRDRFCQTMFGRSERSWETKTQKSIPLWTVHVIPDVLSEVGIQPIWLPPHSSHFLQVLDLLVFVELKRLTEPEEQGRRVQIGGKASAQSSECGNTSSHHP